MDLKKFRFHATEYNIDTLRQLFEELHDVGEVGYDKLHKYVSGWEYRAGPHKVVRRPVPFEILSHELPSKADDSAELLVEVDLGNEEVIIEIEYEGWRESLG